MSDVMITKLVAAYPWFFPLLALVLGGVFGSFLTCALYRCPLGLSLWHPPSACTACQTRLQPVDLIPVVSWVCTKGRCRYCKAVVPFRYVLIELLSIALAFTALFVAGNGLTFLILYAAFMAAFFAIYMKIGWRMTAYKSVAFGLLCFGFYAHLVAS